jgi:16S rRNA (guanine527-N7)-methyltransferase
VPHEAVSQGAAALGVSLNESQCQQLLDYQALLIKWNNIYNLTALRDPQQIWTHHLLDCLAVIPPLRRHLESVPSNAHLEVLDVGSGAGLPGVVMAIAMPELQITCMDAVEKKTSFIREVAIQLKLKSLKVEHGRVEATQSSRFDVIVSRAFASLADFTQSTRHLLAPHGVWMAMKGKTPHEEIAALPGDLHVFHVEPLTVRELEADRCLVWIKPSSTSFFSTT